MGYNVSGESYLYSEEIIPVNTIKFQNLFKFKITETCKQKTMKQLLLM